ncbi:pancreatic triacylglycerol lipase-like [Nylanderia fulva]|uniref:pancreatic triacylglycerol lipase-like n=1 Tax=Nylanderia fulva TaxID=613905 RepID=UPI0010FADC87|nr:pancreatic triacylglycerol lipase-like [Nylanderia fulva]
MLTIVYFYLLLFLVTKVICVEGTCDCSQPDSNFATGVNLIYYKCNNETPATITYPITAPEGLLNVLEDKRTIFYIFGYLQYPEYEDVKLMTEALCYNRTDNVVLLDWSKHSRNTYGRAFQNGEKVGSLFAKSIQLLVNSGLDVSKIYIVGHSLGAHIAGFAGKCNDFVIPRITGLDPANPVFYPLGCYLTSTDAPWVDVIYTDMGGYGTFECVGTANYYVNGGSRPQPGCMFIGALLSQTDVCSHQKSVKLYAESKRDPTKFIATQCLSYAGYTKNNCKDNLQTNVGYNSSNVCGLFYLRTGVL